MSGSSPTLMMSRNWKVVACSTLIRPRPWVMKMRLPDLWKAASASTGVPLLPCRPSKSAGMPLLGCRGSGMWGLGSVPWGTMWQLQACSMRRQNDPWCWGGCRHRVQSRARCRLDFQQGRRVNAALLRVCEVG